MVVQTSVKRPIDKNLVNVVKTTIADNKHTSLLATATYPGTITGIRWSIACVADNGGDNMIYWALVRVKEGIAVGTLATSDLSTLFEPEQEVLAFGIISIVQGDSTAGSATYNGEGSTKTMRKLMNGDQLFVVLQGTNGGASSTFRATFQFFQKT